MVKVTIHLCLRILGESLQSHNIVFTYVRPEFGLTEIKKLRLLVSR